MRTCPSCVYVKEQIDADPALAGKFRIVDIGEDVRDLKRFLALRDSEPAFADARKVGDIGIPCYVLEDGRVTLESSDVGLVPLPEEGAACSLDGSGC